MILHVLTLGVWIAINKDMLKVRKSLLLLLFVILEPSKWRM